MSAHHQHRASLEGTIDFSAQHPDDQEANTRASSLFQAFISEFEPRESINHGYKRITLLRAMHETVQAKAKFLRHLFLFIEKDNFNVADDVDLDFSLALSRYRDLASWSPDQQQELETSLGNFADHLIDAFFLPMKALGSTPILSSSTPAGDHLPDVASPSSRDPSLRRSCLRRDGHRCIVSRKFDIPTYSQRRKEHGGNARDDDGGEITELSYLEVCHIIPHSLVSRQDGRAREGKNQKASFAMFILEMFEPGVTALLHGPEIDRAYNAITLTPDLHSAFGDFRFYFDSTDEPHTYVIRAWSDDQIMQGILGRIQLPLTRVFRLDTHRAIDPPSPRLLGIHRAVGNILHLSAAGDHLDDILRKLEDVRAPMEDGSTDLGGYVHSRLGGWSEVTAH